MVITHRANLGPLSSFAREGMVAHLVAALASRMGRVVGHLQREPGENEITAAQALLMCRRGRTENHIKAWKTHLAADRTSCTRAVANQFRLFRRSYRGVGWTAAQLLSGANDRELTFDIRHAPFGTGLIHRLARRGEEQPDPREASRRISDLSRLNVREQDVLILFATGKQQSAPRPPPCLGRLRRRSTSKAGGGPSGESGELS